MRAAEQVHPQDHLLGRDPDRLLPVGLVALRLHLDDSRLDNGPLRVLPGTHALGLLTESDIGRLTTEISAVDCVIPVGGVMVMRPLIVHASSKFMHSGWLPM